jgi:hypothetical protein
MHLPGSHGEAAIGLELTLLFTSSGFDRRSGRTIKNGYIFYARPKLLAAAKDVSKVV